MHNDPGYSGIILTAAWRQLNVELESMLDGEHATAACCFFSFNTTNCPAFYHINAILW
jgi:hypothetical protein